MEQIYKIVGYFVYETENDIATTDSIFADWDKCLSKYNSLKSSSTYDRLEIYSLKLVDGEYVTKQLEASWG